MGSELPWGAPSVLDELLIAGFGALKKLVFRYGAGRNPGRNPGGCIVVGRNPGGRIVVGRNPGGRIVVVRNPGGRIVVRRVHYFLGRSEMIS